MDGRNEKLLASRKVIPWASNAVDNRTDHPTEEGTIDVDFGAVSPQANPESSLFVGGPGSSSSISRGDPRLT